MRQLVLKFGKNLTCFILLLIVFPSCDDIIESPVPDVYVSYAVNLIIVNELGVPGNSVYFPNVGYGGIIVYCEMPGSWFAFDATCTYNLSRNCIVENNGIVADCPCCESQFGFPNGGYPTKSPASIPLKQYNVSLMNGTTLRIYN